MLRFHFNALALAALLTVLSTVTAQAESVDVTSTTTEWPDGNTYNVTGSVTITGRITVTGTVTLNLGANATLIAEKGITCLAKRCLAKTD